MSHSSGSLPEADAGVTRGPVESGRLGPGIGLAGAAGLGVLVTAAAFAYAVFRYLATFRIFGESLDAKDRFSILLFAVEEEVPILARPTAVAGVWLALLAATVMLIEAVSASRSSEEAAGGEIAPNDGRSRRITATFFSLVSCAVAAGGYLVLVRDRLWTEWAAMGIVTLAGLFGAVRTYSRARASRLPRALLPVMLATSSFLFGALDVVSRWHTLAMFFKHYQGKPLDERDILIVRANAPTGMLALLAPLLVFLTFAAWRWAEGPRSSPGIRSRAPLVLAIASVLLAVSYAGLDRRLRADLAVYTGGSGSNEDIIAFVRVSREMVFPPPPE